jgi:hypothetical protein
MPIKYILYITGLSLVATSAAFGNCALPTEAEIPDGAVATSDEMLAGRAFVEEYMARMELYLDCLSHDKAALPEPAVEADSGLYASQRQAAISKMSDVAEKFNEQVRTYKQRDP